MTRTLYTRDSIFMRLVSTFVALAFTLSLAGSGFAVEPVSSSAPEGSTVATDSPVTDAGVASPPEEAPQSGQDPAVQPEAEPAGAGEATQAVEQQEEAQGSPAAAGAGLSAAAAGDVSVAAALGYADFTQVDWQAYRIDPPAQVGWDKSNLGEYKEGDWIPVRVLVDNTAASATDKLLPGFKVAFDYLNTSANAVAVDGARGFRFTTAADPPPDNPYPAGAKDMTSLFSESVSPDEAYYNVQMATPSTDQTIPAGMYGIVYFQVHLAITAHWLEQDPPHYGAMAYPGSSAQGRFVTWNGSGVGDNTISLPVGEKVEPKGKINGFKFNDLDHDGVVDTGEAGLDGWDFTLHYSGEFSFTETATSAGGGLFTFSSLPAGDYTLAEDISSPWVNTSGLGALTLGTDEQRDIDVGNYIPPLDKDWVLSMDNLIEGCTAFVTYSVNGESATTTLTGSGPCTGTIEVPYGASITDIEWHALYEGVDFLLGVSDDETLTADAQNDFDYHSLVSGKKYNSETLAGISGWKIILKRVVESVETTYAVTTTGLGGTYSFEDVLPGQYAIYEQQETGWLNTVAPSGTFTVGNDVEITGKDFGNLLMAPEIHLEKTGIFNAGANGLADPLELITYTFVVTNPGNIPLTDVSVTDPKVFPIIYVSGDANTNDALDTSETWTYTGTYPVTQADIDAGSVDNTATADSAESAPDTDTATVLLPQAAGLELVKTGIFNAGSNGLADPGELITYTFSVENTGNVTLHGVTVTDPKVINITYVSGDTNLDNALETTETWTYTGTYAVNQADIDHGSVDNTATADSIESGPDSDTETVLLPQAPGLNIIKTGTFGAGANGVADPGELITYTFSVENTGNVTLHGVTVTDPKVTNITYVSGDTNSNNAMEVTETWIYTGTYAVKQVDIDAGSVYNLATADSTESGPDTDDETVPLPQGPGIRLEKTGSWVDGNADGNADAGEVITYQFSVENTGNVTLFNVTVTDPKVIVAGGPITTLPVDAINTTTFTGTYTLTQADVDAGSVYNIALATGSPFVGAPVTDTDDNLVTLPQAPAIHLVKSGTFGAGANGLADPGELITYTFTVTNAGNVTLHGVTVTDPKVSGITYVSGDANSNSALETTETWTYTATYAVTQADIDAGNVVNLATADSTESGPDTDTATVPLPQAPSIGVVKTVSAAEIVLGESVTYTYVVTNTGNLTLRNVTMTDDQLGTVGSTIATLAVGQSMTATMSAAPSVATTNVVTAAGVASNGATVTDTDQAFVNVLLPFTGAPDLAIEKTADKTEAQAGDEVTYKLTYTNIGDGAAVDAVVVDDFDERYVTVVDAGGGTVAGGKITWEINGVIPVGATGTFVYTVRIDSSLPDDVTSVDNVATIETADDTNLANNRATWSVAIAPFLPFTGGEWTIIALMGLLAAAAGLYLRKVARHA